MSPEERQKLCERLRSTWSTVEEQIKAADEIERLAKELEYTRMACERLREDRDEAAAEIERLAALAQSDAEPVAWQTKTPDDIFWRTSPRKRKPGVDPNFFEIRPLYTAPPRPDASAGLIEVADQIQRLQRCLAFFASAIKSGEPWTATCEREYRDALRAHAADRSGK